MKQFHRRLGVKLLCCVLLIPLLAAAIGGSYGLYRLWQDDFYTQTKSEKTQQLFTDQIIFDGYRMMGNYADVMNFGDISEITDLVHWPSNLRYRLTDHTGKQIAANIHPEEEAAWTSQLIYSIEKEDSGYYGEEDLIYTQIYHAFFWEEWNGADLPQGTYLLQAYVEPAFPVNDSYARTQTYLDLGYALRYWGIAIVAACLALGLLCAYNLFATASRRAGSEELFPGPLHRLPSDLAALAVAAFAAFCVKRGVFYDRITVWKVILGLVCAYGALALAVGGAGRAKQGCLLKNTLLCKAYLRLKKLWAKAKAAFAKFYENLPLMWQSALLALGLGLWALGLWLSAWARSGISIVLLLLALPMMIGLIGNALQLRALERSGKALAQGELGYKVDTAKLLPHYRGHGENLNRIGEGMSLAVESRLKSERMKTELVANVSHDIKNPLTSIINYAGLIAGESCENPNHQEYARILGRKSEHLKRLLEDLVEISRANTGNMEVDLQPCDGRTLLQQVAGEFEDRCAVAGLTLLTRQPEEALCVRLDSRRIWRVFENLMQNACKYSLAGSRVYLSLEQVGKTAVFTLRNTSAQPLDMSPEELMERFVRGDRSRTGEGNGLGLSIAQSMTQLQGGEMALRIDGDLFKVTLTFPLAD